MKQFASCWYVVVFVAVLGAGGSASLRAQPAERPPVAISTNLVRRLPAAEAARLKNFEIKGWTLPLAETRLTDLAGHDIAEALTPSTTASGKVAVAATRTGPFVVKTRSIPTLALLADKKTVLPGGLVVPLPPAPDSGGPVTMAWFRLTCAASPQPAAWVDAVRDYVTHLTFGVQLSPGAPPTLQLGEPITVKLDFEGLVSEPVPYFTITAAGLEHEKTVELRFQPSTPEPKLRVRSTIADVDVKLAALPRLALRPQQSSILGFGLESVPVAVEHLLPHGQPSPVPSPTAVDVQVTGLARVTPASITIPAQSARAEFALRSAGLGPVTVQATAAGFAASATLQQRFPTGPFLAALLGGALGGYARRWMKGARRSAAGRHAVEGVVVGFVAFVAAVLGVGYLHLPPLIAATEAGAFLTGVLCGFTGVTVLAVLTKRNTRL